MSYVVVTPGAGACRQMCIDLQSNIVLIPQTAVRVDTSGEPLLNLPIVVMTFSLYLTNLFLHMTHLPFLSCLITRGQLFIQAQSGEYRQKWRNEWPLVRDNLLEWW